MTLLIDSSPYQPIYALWSNNFYLFNGGLLVIILALFNLVFKIHNLKKINQQLLQQIDQSKETEARLKLVFEHSSDDLLLMILDHPIDWNNSIDKEKTLDYVFAHQKVMNINHSSLQQYGATLEEFLGLTPNELFAHDLEQGRKLWRNLFDAGKLHQKTHERKLDGTPILIEGNYICFYDEQGRIKGHLRINPNSNLLKTLENKAIQIDKLYQEIDTFFIQCLMIYALLYGILMAFLML